MLLESVEVEPNAGAYALRLLGAPGRHGTALVAFEVDGRDGVPRLMNINARFRGSLHLAIDGGVAFPALLIDGDTQPRPWTHLPAHWLGRSQ